MEEKLSSVVLTVESITINETIMENKIHMPTIESLVQAIKRRAPDGKLTILDVYAAVRDLIYMQSSGREEDK